MYIIQFLEVIDKMAEKDQVEALEIKVYRNELKYYISIRIIYT